jgi:hypothetical protein
MSIDPESNPPQILIYETDDKIAKVSVRLVDESLWLTNLQLAQLFQVSKATVSEHIKNIIDGGELSPDSVVRNFRTTAADGKSYDMSCYNLDMIISLGYRINSKIATKFRQWATVRLREYIIKGFAMDDARLKELGGGGYWKELLARIRDIRASEKVFYRQILDIYATSMDYDAKTDASIAFFKKVQNKIHFAVHGQTAAEVIYARADAEKEFMGLLTFSGDRPHLADAVIAKNYLNEKELRALGQIVSGYLDFAERQAEREIPMTMADWSIHLDKILTSTGEKLLLDAGSVSHGQAMEKAREEYQKYQEKTLSGVEKDYLQALRDTEQKLQKTPMPKKKPTTKKKPS